MRIFRSAGKKLKNVEFSKYRNISKIYVPDGCINKLYQHILVKNFFLEKNNFYNYGDPNIAVNVRIPMFDIAIFGQNWHNCPICGPPGEKNLWPNFLVHFIDPGVSPESIQKSVTELCPFP